MLFRLIFFLQYVYFEIYPYRCIHYYSCYCWMPYSLHFSRENIFWKIHFLIFFERNILVNICMSNQHMYKVPRNVILWIIFKTSVNYQSMSPCNYKSYPFLHFNIYRLFIILYLLFWNYPLTLIFFWNTDVLSF